MATFAEALLVFCDWLILSTVRAGVLILFILAVQSLLRARLVARWRCWFWVLLLVQMAMPWVPESRLSVFNLMPRSIHLSWPESATDTIPSDTFAPMVALDSPAESPATPHARIQDVTAAETPLAGSTAEPIALTSDSMEPVSTGPTSLASVCYKLLPFAWLGGALILAGYIGVTNFSLWWTVRRGKTLTDQKTLDLLEQCKFQMGIRTILGVVLTERIKTPALFGYIRPRLLLPNAILETLSLEDMRYVFLHELAHLKRHDILFGWVTALLQALHWFNPLVWVAFRRMRMDRELACDALALSSLRSEKAQAYGRTIVNLLERFSQPRRLPALAGILESKSHLKRRVTMIARFKKRSYRWSALAVAALVMLGSVTLTGARASSGAAKADPEALAKEFVQLLVSGQFEKATEHFDATMKKALPAEKLALAWKSTTDQAAPFKRQLGVRTEKYLSNDIVLVTCEFAKGPLDVKVVFDKDGRITGLWFVPTPQEVLNQYELLQHPKTGNVTTLPEEKVTFGPVVERVVQAPVELVEGKRFSFIDFESGRILTWPSDWEFPKHRDEWAEKNGLDAVIRFRRDNSFEGYAGMFLPITNDYWDSITPKKLARMLTRGTLRKTVYIKTSPMTCAFMTREKGMGILQILESVGRPSSHMRIRYKMLKHGPSRIRDKIDYPFVGDPSAIGSWRSVDVVAEPDDFEPNARKWKRELYLKSLVFLENGKTTKPWWTWTRGLLLHHGDKTASKYVIKQMDGREYMFLEWKSGDYTIRGMKPKFYVLTRVTRADKREAEDLAGEGWRLWRDRKLAEAEGKFKQAVAKDATNASAWNGLGWAQQNQRKLLNAKHSFEECLTIDPKHPGALNGLGWIAKAQGKTQESIKHWEKAVAALPTATAALNGLATTYMELAQYDKAIKYYRMWLKAEPKNKDAKAGVNKAATGAEAAKVAAAAAETWLGLVDLGRYAESWDNAAALFKLRVTKAKWQESIKAARGPLGKVQARRLLSARYTTALPGAPDGDYVVIQYQTAFEPKHKAVETITPMKDKDGKWRVSGYYIK